MYGDEVGTFKVDGCIVVFDLFTGFVGAHELGYLAPIAKSMSTYTLSLLL
jgi:hypothetical protein